VQSVYNYVPETSTCLEYVTLQLFCILILEYM